MKILDCTQVFLLILAHKKRQATCITPLRPNTFAAFPPWRIQRELVVQDLPLQKYYPFTIKQGFFL
jgi:hypothetical protein